MSDATQAKIGTPVAARSSLARPMGCCSTTRHVISVYYAVGPIPVLLGCVLLMNTRINWANNTEPLHLPVGLGHSGLLKISFQYIAQFTHPTNFWLAPQLL
jgi:hypothetical protein